MSIFPCKNYEENLAVKEEMCTNIYLKENLKIRNIMINLL